jgi:CxxC-x17-CxxC domain-containing protein
MAGYDDFKPKGNSGRSSRGRSDSRGSSRDRPGGSRGGFGSRGSSRDRPGGSRDRGSSRDRPDRGGGRGRSSGRGDSRGGRGGFGGRDRPEMTKVTCSSCKKECEVPFKPTSDKPVYCSNCFEKNDPRAPQDHSKDFEVIKEKLNKIMKALEIE